MSFIYKRPGSPYYYYGWTDDAGVKHGKVLKPKTANHDEAEVLKGIEDRKRFAGETDTIAKGVPWKRLKESVLGEHRGKTRAIYQNAFGHFERLAHPTTVSEFTYADAKAFKAKLRDYQIQFKIKPSRPLKDNSVNIVLRSLRATWSEAVRLGWAAKNVWNDVQQIPVTKRVPRYLTKAQVKALKAAARQSPGPDTYLMVLFLLHTGIRKQELLNLRWSAIDLERQFMYLHGSETWDPKDRQEHAIGLHRHLVKGLKGRPRTSTYIFPGKDGGVRDATAAGRLFNRLYRRAGIAYTGLHINRHTFATHYPGSEKSKQLILGHADPRTTQQYSHVTKEELDSVREMDYE